jgi:hypothetical protein
MSSDQAAKPAGSPHAAVWAALILGGFVFLSVCVVVAGFALGAFKQTPAAASVADGKADRPSVPAETSKLYLRDVIVGTWSLGGDSTHTYRSDSTVVCSWPSSTDIRGFTGHYWIKGQDELWIQPPAGILTPIIIDGVAQPQQPPPPWSHKVKVIDRDTLEVIGQGSKEKAIWKRR